MRQVTDGRLPLDAAVRTHIDLCLNCRACETACPSGVRYHEVLEPFRAGLAKLGHHGKPLPWVQRLAMNHLFPFRSRSRWALAPLKLLQRIGIDKFLSKLLPSSARSMQDTLPRLKAHYGRIAGSLAGRGEETSAGGVVSRLRGRRGVSADESGDGPGLATQWLRGVDTARAGLLRGAGFSRSSGRACQASLRWRI